MFGPAERIADAVLYEGYVLYPYRASADKNRMRWQFGVIAPHAPADDGEPSFSHTECLIEVDGQPLRVNRPRLWVRLRSLRPTAADATGRGWLDGVPTTIDALMAMPIARDSFERVVFLDECGISARLIVRAWSLGAFIKLQLV